MKNLYLLILFSLLFSSISYSQTINVKGQVINQKVGTPIPGVTIYISRLHVGTISNYNGEFNLRASLGDSLVFRSLGFKTQKVKITGSYINMKLEESSTQLQELEITAKSNINDIKIREATGAIETISMDKLNKRPTINPLESLQGQVAGVYIQTSGELGKPPKVRIRGTSTLAIQNSTNDEDRDFINNKANEPLYVLDGQVITSDFFATINPNDIEEIKILKDAMANALYGIKAANGVIEITSKRGVNGKTEYSAYVNLGVTLRGDPSVQMMSSSEKLEFERKAKVEHTPGYYFSEEYIRKQNKGSNVDQLVLNGQKSLDSLRNINTDWFKELTRISHYQSYNVSSRGGNDKNRFYFSGSYSAQGGKFDGNNIDRFTSKLNYEYNLSENIYLMFNSGFGISENNTPNSSDYSPASLIYELNPYEQREEGKLISYPGRTYKDLVNQYSKNSEDKTFNFSGNVNANLTNNLVLSSIFGLNYMNTNSLSIIPSTSFEEQNSGVPDSQKGKATQVSNSNFITSTNTRLNYSVDIQKHEIMGSANIDYVKTVRKIIGVAGYGLPSKLTSAAGINNDIKGARRSITSSRNVTEAQLGYGFAAHYGYNDIIDLDFSYKSDGSSIMPSNKRWNTFWASGIAITLSELGFLQNSKIISSLVLRSTYGVTANISGISPSLTVPIFSYKTDSYQEIRSFYLKDMYNEDLRPEQNNAINLGVDLGVFKKVNMSVELYHRRTSDMLLNVPIAPSNGFHQQLKNVGVMENQGLEFSIYSTVVKNQNFSWNMSGNISYNQNKVIDLYEGDEITLSSDQPFPDYKEGYPADVIYGLKDLGVHPVDGTKRYQRADGSEMNAATEKANPEDFVVLGYSTPPYNGGLFQSFTYKKWTFSFDLYFTFGGIARYSNQSVASDVESINKNAVSGQLEATWFEPGDEFKRYPSLYLSTGNLYENLIYPTDRLVGKTDFIRLNNITFQYTFDTSKFSGWSQFVKSWRLYGQARNIFTWSGFGGGDPESANLIESTQPIITFGSNLTF